MRRYTKSKKSHNDKKTSFGTYNNDTPTEYRIHEEIARLRKTAALPLNRAPILVHEVWIHKNRKFRFRYQKRREYTPHLWDNFRSKHRLGHEDVRVQADDTAIAEGRDGEGEGRNGPGEVAISFMLAEKSFK